jgi:hypothetical protein
VTSERPSSQPKHETDNNDMIAYGPGFLFLRCTVIDLAVDVAMLSRCKRSNWHLNPVRYEGAMHFGLGQDMSEAVDAYEWLCISPFFFTDIWTDKQVLRPIN